LIKNVFYFPVLGTGHYTSFVIHCQYERISNFVIGGYLHSRYCWKEYLILWYHLPLLKDFSNRYFSLNLDFII